MGDKFFSLPFVQNDRLRMVDSGETVSAGKAIHLLELIGFRPKTIRTGQKKVATTNTAVALGSGKIFNSVKIKAKSTNAGNIFVGGTGVATTDDGTGSGFRLLPGESAEFVTDDLSRIFINGAANDSVYFHGS